MTIPRIPAEILPFLVVGALFLGHRLLSGVSARILHRTGAAVLESAVAAARRPLYMVLAPLGILLTLPALRLRRSMTLSPAGFPPAPELRQTRPPSGGAGTTEGEA